jgi:hypothetical protein
MAPIVSFGDLKIFLFLSNSVQGKRGGLCAAP